MSTLGIIQLVLTLELINFCCFSARYSQGKDTTYFLDEISEELSSYEFVTPQLHSDGRWRRDINTLVKKVGYHSDKLKVKIYSSRKKKSYIVQLELNRDLLPSHSTTSYFDENGNVIIAPFQAKDHCYYQGFVQGLPDSSAAFSTCKGIEGYIFDGKDSFYVQPVNSKPKEDGKFRHIFYNMKDLKKKEHTCGHTADSFKFNPKQLLHGSHHQHKRVRRNVLKESKYVELVIVNDNKQYKKYNHNVKDTENRAKQVANFVDSVYRPLNIRIALVHIITWNDYDKIATSSNADILLENFLKYAKGDMRSILKKAGVKTVDNSMLLSGLDFQGSTVGKAYLKVMCSDRSTGITQDHSTNAAFTASTLAHEMGHNFGLGHDDNINGCFCNNTQGNCIMHSVSSGSKPMTTWSVCSVNTLKANLLKGLDSCLFNKPSKIYGDPVCGNGFTESGEECDCGTPEECRKYSAGCCNATTCKLNPGAECDEGVCCRSCRFLPQNIKCREKLNECDIPEYCTGKSGQCPENVYIQNGKPCSSGKGFCYNGICPTHEQQCKSFWGKDAVSGPDLCYNPNTRGDLYGNCNEFQDGTYQKCNLEDVLCGSLHCTSSVPGVDLPSRPVNLNTGWKATYRTFFEEGGTIKCNKLSISTSDDVPNPGKTREGTKCGENKLCKDSRCIHVDELSWLLPLCQGNCSNHGLCTNKGYCVCDSLWTGSDCATAITCPPGTSCTTQGSQTIIIAITIPIILFVILVAVVVVFLWRRGSKLPRIFDLRNIKSDKKNSLTRNAAALAQGTPDISRKQNDKSRAPTSPTNFGFESAGDVSLPTTKFSGAPVKYPVRPAPSRSAVVPMNKPTSPFQTPAPTDSNKDVKSLRNSPPKKPVLPPSVPKTKPLTPNGNLPDGRNMPAQVVNDPLPVHSPPLPPLQQKPVGQDQSRLPNNPPTHPFLRQKSSGQAQNQKQTGISLADVKNKLPLNPPPHPFGKKKVVGNLYPDQPESKQSVSKAQLPTKPPPHPFLKKLSNDSQQQESGIVKSEEPQKPVKPVKPARPIPTPRNNLSNQVLQTKQGNSSGEDKTVNESSAQPTSNLKGKPLVPTTKPKFSPTPSPRNRIVTPAANGVTNNKVNTPLRPPIVGQKPPLSAKPQFSKDTVEPSHSSQNQKQAVEPRPLPASKPAGTPSVPVPPKKSTGGKVPLLPPGAKLR